MNHRTTRRPVLAALLAAALIGGASVSAAAAPRFDAETMQAPASCGHAALRLSGGRHDFGTAADGSSRGDVSLVSPHHQQSTPVRDPLVARQLGHSAHGVAEAVPIVCSAGGVDHPEIVVFATARGSAIASTGLGRFTRQEHAAVTAIRLRNDHARVHWDAYDGAGLDIHHLAVTLTLRSGRLVASHLTTEG